MNRVEWEFVALFACIAFCLGSFVHCAEHVETMAALKACYEHHTPAECGGKP